MAGTHATSVALYPALAYKPEVDFEPIGMVSEVPQLLVARKESLEIKTLRPRRVPRC